MFRYFDRLREQARELVSAPYRKWLVLIGLIVCLGVPALALAQPTPPSGGTAPTTAPSTAPTPPASTGAAGTAAAAVSTAVTSQIEATMIGLVARFLGIFVEFLGSLTTLLVNVLMGFLQYNDFGHAAPVEIGWKILRDLSNMFFIVILLASAFATIVSSEKYAELHVRKVLPKLLFTAVTINFSKTIVSLMIDASQVVMLTFVNAFQAVGVGNFVQALHLTDAMGINAAAVNTSASNILVQVIISYMLAIAMLVLTVGVVLIMIIFIVTRIIGLWMALIFAPLAFLIGALPGKIAEKMGKFSKDYWPKLNGLLFGGPIIAFFLWLTFATVASMNGDQSLNFFQNVITSSQGTIATGSQSVIAFFITSIGQVPNLASYIIAIVMMTMGVDAALDAMSSVGGPGQALAKQIGEKSKSYAQKIAAAPFTAPVAAAKGAANYVDRRADISGRAAAAARMIPLVDRFAGDKLRKIQFARREEWDKEKANRLSDYKKATRPTEKKMMKFLAGANASTAPIIGTPGDELGYAAILEAEGSAEKATKRSKELGKPIEEAFKKADVHANVAKGLASQRGNQQASQERLTALTSALNVLDPERDKEQYEKINDEIGKIKKENPAFLTDPADRKKAMAGVESNLANLSDDQTSDLEVMLNSTNEQIREDAFGTDFVKNGGVIKPGDTIALGNFMAAHKGKPTEKKAQALIDYVKNSPSGVKLEDLRNFSIQKGKDDSYAVYDKMSGKKVVTEKQQIAEDALRTKITDVGTDDHGRVRDPETGKGIFAVDPSKKDLKDPSTPAGNAFIASIPHIGISEALKRVDDASDGAGMRTIENQFKAAGQVINTNDPDYDESNDYIKAYDKQGATDQEKFAAQTKFQQDYRPIESIVADVHNVEPSKRVEMMAMMDKHGADRFVSAKGNLLNEDQKNAAKHVKEMAVKMANGVQEWRFANTKKANDGKFVVQEAPQIRKASRITKKLLAGEDISPSEKKYMEWFEKSDVREQAEKRGMFKNRSTLELHEDRISQMERDADVQEGMKYARAARFISNVTRESSGGRRKNRK